MSFSQQHAQRTTEDLSSITQVRVRGAVPYVDMMPIPVRRVLIWVTGYDPVRLHRVKGRVA